MEALDQPAEEGGDAARDLSLAPLAVGEAGAVGGVDDGSVGKELERRLEHRQATDAGIEEQDWGVRVHHPSSPLFDGEGDRTQCGGGVLSTQRLTMYVTTPSRLVLTSPAARRMVSMPSFRAH